MRSQSSPPQSSLWRTLFVLTLLLLPAAALEGQHPPQPADFGRSIDAIVEEALVDGPIAGASVAVVRGNEVILLKGYGFADLENQVPANAETVYRIGSITKQFTAAAIMKLREEGRIAMNDRVATYFPDLPMGSWPVTVHQILNMTSGIRNYTAIQEEWPRQQRLDLTHDELIGLFVDRPFDFDAGDRFSYSNSGYYMAGVIIEQLSGLTYGEYLEKYIYAPAGMTDSRYCDDAPIVPRRARGYATSEGELQNAAFISMANPGAAGALCSTVLDLVRWNRALVDHRVVGAESYRLMTTPGTLNNGEKTVYGYGLRMDLVDGHRKVSHGGGINGFSAQLAYFPDRDLTVAVLTNTAGSWAGDIERRISSLLLGSAR